MSGPHARKWARKDTETGRALAHRAQLTTDQERPTP